VAPPHAPTDGDGCSLAASEDGGTDAGADADADADPDADGDPATADPDGDAGGGEVVADGVHAATSRTAARATERAERPTDGMRIGGESSDADPQRHRFVTRYRLTP